MFTSIKDFTLTTLAVFYNLTPFFTVAFGYFLLKEKVNCIDITSVICGFAAVISITYGMAKTKLAAEEIDPK
jgi:drug/metabolite transporter (DMT)-like permease